MKTRRSLAALLLAAAVSSVAQPASAPVAAGTTATAAARLVGPAHCRFAVPKGLDARQVRWTGDCRDRLAQGLGTLRALQGNKVLGTFYGRLKNGQPVLGVVEVDGGFLAGRFENGAAVQDGERNTLIQGFETAAAAAAEVAQRYQASGNPASARFYRQKASQLAKQMD